MIDIVRVATWNVNYRDRIVSSRLGRLVHDAGVELLLLQEANPASLGHLAEAAGLDWAFSAFDAGAALPTTSGRRRVAAIAGRGAEPTQLSTLAQLPLPERMLIARLDTSLGALNVASYHAPPGVSWGHVKVEHAHALLDWVNRTSAPLLIGADANTPEIDHPDPDQVRTHWHTGLRRLAGRPGDDIMFGGRPQHRLQDAYRAWLNADPERLHTVTDRHPAGPLAVSHHTGKRRNEPGTPRRYDALWISPDLTATTITYDYLGAITAGTDHALLVAELARTAPRALVKDQLPSPGHQI